MNEADAFGIVEPVFQVAVDGVGAERWLEPEILRRQSPAMRMLLSTRAVDGLVANGGWIAVAIEDQLNLLPLALEGYVLLGLESHAAIVRRALVLPFDADDEEPAGWADLDDEWFGLADPDVGRAAYIAAHPREFST